MGIRRLYIGIETCMDAGGNGKQNLPETVNWYRKAAERRAGNPASIRKLRDACLTGSGVGRDISGSLKWYNRAARKRDPKSLGDVCPAVDQSRTSGRLSIGITEQRIRTVRMP